MGAPPPTIRLRFREAFHVESMILPHSLAFAKGQLMHRPSRRERLSTTRCSPAVACERFAGRARAYAGGRRA
jgi:hypothetical protein